MISSSFSQLTNPTNKHKDWYRLEYIKIFCAELNKQNHILDQQSFHNQYKKHYRDLELKDRLELIARLYDEMVEGDYTYKLSQLKNLFGPPLENESGMFTYGFYLYPLSKFVEIYGAKNIKDIKSSLDFLEELTQRFTGEWAIRPLAIAAPEKTLTRVNKWSKHSNVHLRRLASEGLRPRLPWGKKIEWVDKNPKLIIPIYDLLRNDESLYVRKSVGNSMGDIIKLDPDLALKTFQRWLRSKKTKENLWVIKHAIRLPVKKKAPLFLKFSNEIKKYTLSCQ